MFGKQKLQFNGTRTNTGRKVFAVILVFVSVIVTSLFASPVQTADAAIPKYINFQGKLTAVSNGSNVANGTYTFEFKLYDALSGGSLLWTETWDGSPSPACDELQVTNGVFNAKLGACNPLTGVDFTSGNLYLSVNFDPGSGFDGEMSPRKQLVSSAYSFVANGVSGDGRVNVTPGQSATALTVARSGTDYAFQVDTNTASSATGLKVTSAAAASGLALNVISSGTNENLTLDAKGSGTISLGATSTGSTLFGGGYGSTGVSISSGGNIQANGTLTIDSTTTLTGALTLTSVAGAGTKCLQTDNAGLVTAAAAACGTGSLTPWTSDIDADGYDLNDLSNILFRETTGAPAGSDVAIFRDNSGDLNANVLTAKTFNVQVNSTDEYNFSSTALAMNSNNITGVGTAITGAAGVTLSSTSADLALATNTSGNITLQAASTGSVQITSGVSTGTTTSSAVSLVANSLTSGTGANISSSSVTSGTLLNLASTGTAALTGNKALSVSQSGANGTGAQTTYGLYSTNTRTGTSNNVAGYFSASGGDNNYAAIFENGNVGIGTTAPAARLDVSGTDIGVVYTSGFGQTFNLVQKVDNTITTDPATDYAASLISGISMNIASGTVSGTQVFGLFGTVVTTATDGATYDSTSPLNGVLGISNLQGTGSVNMAVGGNFGVVRAGTGVVTNMRGINVQNQNYVGASTIADVRGINIQQPVHAGGSTMTNIYGLYLENQTPAAGTVTNTPYGIYQAGSANYNYFAGNTGIGTTAPTGGKLQVNTNDTTPSLLLVAADNQPYIMQATNSTFSSSPAFSYYIENDGTFLQGTDQATDFQIYTDGYANPRLTIDSAGDVGIGTTAPDRPLEVNSATGLGLRLTYNDADGSAANYADLQVSSAGALNILPSGFIANVGGGATRTALRFLEPSGTGTDYAAIQANANVTTSYTWTLPAADASGCIQSNGSGALSIAACGGGGLTVGTTAIASGNAGRILFEGAGNVLQEAAGLAWDNTDASLVLTTSSTTAANKALNVSQTGATSGTDYAGYFSNTGAATTNIGLYSTATGATNNYAAIFENGLVGIGITTPQARLDISGTDIGVNYTTPFGQVIKNVQKISNTITTDPATDFVTGLLVGSNMNIASGTVSGTQISGLLISGGTDLTDGATYDSTSPIIGVYSASTLLGTGSVDTASGGTFNVIRSNTGVVTNMRGVNVQNLNYIGSGTIADVRGINIQQPASTAGSTMTNIYGLYLENQTPAAGTVTNTPYGIYQAGSANYNYFAGNTGIGATSPSAKLQVVDNVTGFSSTNAVAKISGTGGAYGLISETAGIAQFSARSTTHTDRELRFQLYSDGNVYFSNALFSGSAAANLIIATGADSGTNTGEIRISPGGSQSTVFAYGGNVGIGDTSPAALLTVGSGDLFQVASSGNLTSSNAGTWTFSNDTNFALTGGVNGLSIDGTTFSVDGNSDRVGIGTAAPVVKFQVAGTALIQPDTTWSSGDSSVLLFSDDNSNRIEAYYTPAANSGSLNLRGYSGVDLTTNLGVVLHSTQNAMTNIGSNNDADALLEINGNRSVSAWGLNGIQLQASTSTFTDSSTAISGTATNAVFNSFAAPTLAATNTSVTTTNAATVYIANAPTAGTNQTITNAYSLWVDNGNVRFDGSVGIGTSAPDKALEINSAAGNNLRLTYNDADGSAANYADLLTTSAGHLTIAPSGSVVNLGSGASTPQVALRFYEEDGNGGDYTGIQAASDVTTSYTWTLPDTDASGCIQSNGSGTLSIGTCGGSASWSALTAPSGNLSLAHGANTTSMTFNSVTTGTAWTQSSSSITSGTLYNFGHSSSTFTGSGILMNMANGSGSFTGNFADFQVNGTSRFKVNSGTVTTSGASAVAGVLQDMVMTNSTGSGFQYGNRAISTISSGTAGTHVGQFVRMIDNTTLNAGQNVRGLEVQAYSGTNVNGTNTGIASFAYTFGIQATTTAQAASQATPAAVFADLDNGSNATVGNAIRAYSDNATSADLVYLYQETSAYTGNALLMDIGNGAGSFASGNFINLKNAGSSKYTVDYKGELNIFTANADNDTSIYIDTEETTTTQNVFAIESDTTNGSGADTLKFKITADGSTYNDPGTFTTPADIAEMYNVIGEAEPGDVVEIAEATGFANGDTFGVKKHEVDSTQSVVGVISTKPGQTLGYEWKRPEVVAQQKPVALAGRVPVKVTNENGVIEPGDFLAPSRLVAGHAMKANKAGAVIGQALESFSGGVGKIEAFVKATTYNGVSIESELAGLDFDYTDTSEQGLANSAENSSEILEYLLSQLPNLDDNNLSQVSTDVVIAAGEIITPTVTAQTLRADFLTSATTDGGLEVASTAMFGGGLTVDNIGAIGDLLSFSSDVEFFGTPYFTTDTAGFAVVKAGVQSVDVVFGREYLAQPIVSATVSFEQETDQELLDENARGVLRDVAVAQAQAFLVDPVSYVVTNKSKYGFTIVLNKTFDRDIKLSWIALAVRNATTFMSLDVPENSSPQGGDDGSGDIAGDFTPDPGADSGDQNGGTGDDAQTPPSDPPSGESGSEPQAP